MKEENALQTAVTPPDAALGDFQSLFLTELGARDKRLLLNGASIACGGELARGELVKTYLDGSFLGLGKREEAGFHISVFFTGDEPDGN